MPNLDPNERCPASGLTNRDCINSICDCFPTEEDRWGLHPEYFEVSLDLPYGYRTRQEEGRRSEKKQAKKYGLRLHPNSGAGNIKQDASDESTLVEFKDVGKVFTLNAADLLTSQQRAVRTGRDAVWVITFANGVEVVAHVTRKGNIV